MKYDDYARLSDENYKIMKQSYENVITEETADLQEILEKLIKQRKTLHSNNSDNKYDEMLEKLDNNIADLNSLISGNLSQVASKNSAFIPSYYGLRSKKLDLGNDAISPIRSHKEMLSHGDIVPTQPSTPSDNNQNGNSDSNVPQNGTTTPNTPKRNSPMQGSALSNIIKQLNVGANRILGRNRKQRTINSNNLASQNTQVPSQNHYNKTTHNPNNSQSQIRPSNLSEMNNIFMPYPMTPPKYDYMHRPPHHPRPNMPHGCEPHDIILSGQCDIVRMILLYMMLRPNCRYISRLCNVANDQFEILQLLM